jgi:hypothetical protein
MKVTGITKSPLEWEIPPNLPALALLWWARYCRERIYTRRQLWPSSLLVNYNKPGNFYDDSILADAAGKLGAGLRPFRDFSSALKE